MSGQPNNTDNFEDEIVKELRTQFANGKEIDVFETAIQLDLRPEMKAVKKWFLDNSICDKAEYAGALKQARIKRELGYIPKTAVEYVDKWIAHNKISVNYQQIMKQEIPAQLDGVEVTADARKDKTIDGIARIIENSEINIATLGRDLRLKAAELGLRFRDSEISDAIDKWFETALNRRVVDVFAQIAFTGSPKAKDKLDAWDAVASQFEVSETSAAFVVAVLQKFIWQVKRKMIGLPISNHLMPVILGPQGVGKSTFVRDIMLQPVEELTGATDFKMIEEDRNTEQWRNYVLFLDEMGFAGKADIDAVKNKITAPSVTGRPMRTNSNVQYRQNATFIGCSNKELNQLIRDETGNRRFVALRYSSTPDWSLTKGLNPILLWNSVDEHGADPTTSITDQLREQQEYVRERSVVEQWLDEHKVPSSWIGKRKKAKELYDEFKPWAETYTAGRVWDLNNFSKEMVRLIRSGQVTNWSIGSQGGANVYIPS
ncbi:VapE domain-containing protein [Rhizobium sp. L43]|uniref:VapE domain-containing protein n=1 Tax=Rhizobium sp. L43 TaxID=2035452 RepID=UPI0015CF716F|nr:VapE domain-containing protein [Rhizobium sp. L43]